MLEYFKENHMDKYKNKSGVIFFKGFDENFFKGIEEVIPRAFNHKWLEENEKDFNRLKKDSKKIAKEFIINQDEKIYFARYEELLALKDYLSLMEGEKVIITNNFLEKYPYGFKGLEDEIKGFMDNFESEALNENTYEFSEYFGAIEKVEEDYFVLYKDIDEELEIRKEDLIQGSQINLSGLIERNEDLEDIIEFPNQSNNRLLKKKIELLNNSGTSDINLCLEKYVVRSEKHLKQLYSMVEYCKSKGIQVNLYEQFTKIKKKFREEFKGILLNYWGSNNFRELEIYSNPDTTTETSNISQGAIIEDIVEQVERARKNSVNYDIFITAPTGSGKSVLFQIPALYLMEKYKAITIIVSPLKALMKDQVEGLKQKGIDSACYLNSDQSYIEREESIQRIKEGKVSLLYLSPELLIANSNIENLIGDREIGAFIIDEAHTVSTWGRDFRVDYWLLGTYVDKIRKYKNNFPIVATTATAIYNGPNDTIFEIVNSLRMRNPKFYIGRVRKDNIDFNIRKADNIENSHDLFKAEKTLEVIRKKVEKGEKTIIYFPYTTQIEDIYDKIPEGIRNKVVRYHSKLDLESKQVFEAEFKGNKKTVMLATKAFGMGIDIDNIESIHHYAPAGGLADYVQEIGRCARNKDIVGVAETDFHERDLKFVRTLKHLSGVKQWQVRLVMEKLFELYKINGRKQNMLVTPESFSYIFNGNDDLEQKVKLALLSVENDFINKYTYPVVIIRPKMTFTKAYVAIRKEKEGEILTGDNKDFFRRVSTMEENSRVRISGFGRRRSEIIIRDLGDIYEFDLERFWEEKHNDTSFQHFLYKFYSGQIFNDDDLNPRLNLSITLNKSREEVRDDMEAMLSNISKVLTGMEGYFSKKDFSNKLQLEFKSEKLCRKIANVIFGQYTFKFDPSGMEVNKDKFLRSKRVENEEKYCLINSNLLKVQGKLRNYFNEILQKPVGEETYSKYISFKSDVMELAYMLEALELANYEVCGGRVPKIFVRLNDPNKLYTSVTNERFTNSVISRNEKRNKTSEEILRYFFSSEMDCDFRWDFIEEYFLGRDVIEDHIRACNR